MCTDVLVVLKRCTRETPSLVSVTRVTRRNIEILSGKITIISISASGGSGLLIGLQLLIDNVQRGVRGCLHKNMQNCHEAKKL